MPACTSTSTTVSPAEGLPLVLLVTVPVIWAALANAVERKRLDAIKRKKTRVDLIVLNDSLLSWQCNALAKPAAKAQSPPSAARFHFQAARAGRESLLQDTCRRGTRSSSR